MSDIYNFSSREDEEGKDDNDIIDFSISTGNIETDLKNSLPEGSEVEVLKRTGSALNHLTDALSEDIGEVAEKYDLSEEDQLTLEVNFLEACIDILMQKRSEIVEELGLDEEEG